MKKILEYLLVFIMTLIILFFGLALTAKIPKTKIEENLKKSASYLEKNSGFKRVQPGREYTYLHLYADSVILNIINCIDTNIIKTSPQRKSEGFILVFFTNFCIFS